MTILPRLAPFAFAAGVLFIASGCPFDPTEETGPVASIAIYFGDENFYHGEKTIGVGETVTAHANVVDRDAQDVATPVTWTSSNPAVASIPSTTSAITSVTGVSPGVVTITVSAGGKTTTRQLTVTTITGTASGIVFSSTRDGNSEIYILDESGPRRLTQDAASDITPSKSGSRIYFSSNRSGNYEIYSMKLDGTDVTRLTNNTVTDNSPSVSVNGVIAFMREVTPGHQQIFTMNLQGQSQVNISNNTFNETSPVWTPDGTKLAYASDRDAKYGPNQYLEIYSMNADGSGVTRLTTNDNGIDYYPAWSPDGSRLAFTSNRSANPTDPQDPKCYDQALEIWVMNSNGTGLRNLTSNCRGDASPSWSPDGSEIVFLSDRGSATAYAWDLWKIPAAGGTATRLTTTGKDAAPVWR